MKPRGRTHKLASTALTLLALVMYGPSTEAQIQRPIPGPMNPYGFGTTNTGTYELTKGWYSGFVAARGVVTQEVNGKQVPVWAEYTADFLADASGNDLEKRLLGGVVLWQQPAVDEYEAAQVLSRPEYEANRRLYQNLLLQQPNRFDILSATEYAQQQFLDADQHAITAPPLKSGITHVAVLKQPLRVFLSNYNLVLEQFAFDPRTSPDFTGRPEQTFLICTKGDCEGQLLRSAPGTIAYLSDYFQRDEEAFALGTCSDAEMNQAVTFEGTSYETRMDTLHFVKCAPWDIKRVLSPLVGVEVITPYGSTVTDERGHFQKMYSYYKGTGIYASQTKTSVDQLMAILEYSRSDPRVPLKHRFAAMGVAATGIDQVFSQAYTNIPVRVALFSAKADVFNEVNDSVPIEPPEPSVRFDDEGNQTLYKYARPSYTKRHEFEIPIGGAPSKDEGTGGNGGDGGDSDGHGGEGGDHRPTYTRFLPEAAGGTTSQQGDKKPTPAERENEVVHRGLLDAISRADMTEKTEIYLFSPGGSKISERLQLKLFETPGVECPNSPNDCEVVNPGVQAGFRLREFFPNRYPGARLRLVAINRATGYMATGFAVLNVGAGPSDLRPVEVTGTDGGPLKMRPPNLVVNAVRTRVNELTAQTATTLIGFEGGGMTNDRAILITTEWRDWDGTPLPDDLPGFTGRIAREIAAKELGPVAAGPEVTGGQFNIKPGRATHFLKLGKADDKLPESYHYYVHVSGQRSDSCQGAGCVDFSTSPTAEGPLKYRPTRYVPVKVPVFDEEATTAALKTNIALARNHQGQGPAQNIVAKVDPIYTNVYRPEYQFSVYDLKESHAEIITAYDPALEREVTKLTFDYTLSTWGKLDPLDPLGPDENLVWGIGYDEILATVNAAGGTTIEDLDALQGMTPSQQLGQVKGAIGKLGPADYLGLELYADADRGNPLYSQPQIYPLIQATPQEITLHRRMLLSTWNDEAEALGAVEDYRAIPFSLTRPAQVELLMRNKKGGPPTKLPVCEAGEGLCPALARGDYYTVIATKMFRNGIAKTPNDFTLSLEATEGDELHKFVHRVEFPVTVEETMIGNAMGQIVEDDVNIVDGSVNLLRTDFSLPWRGPNFALTRAYSSAGISSGGILGAGWSHSFQNSLVPLLFGQLGEDPETVLPEWVEQNVGKLLTKAKAEEFLFAHAPPLSVALVNGIAFRALPSGWTPERGRHGTLEAKPAGCDTTTEPNAVTCSSYIYTSPDGTRYTYPSPVKRKPADSTQGTDPTTIQFQDSLYTRLGLGIDEMVIGQGTGQPATPGEVANASGVKRIDDRFGNGMTLLYDSKGYLKSVMDDSFRICHFKYSPNPACPQQYEGKKRRLYGVVCDPGALGSGGAIADVSYCYDSDGNLSVASSNGREEFYEYDPYVYTKSPNQDLKDFNLVGTVDGYGTTVGYSYDEGEDPAENLGLKAGYTVHKREFVRTVRLPPIANVDGPTYAPLRRFTYQGAARTVDDLIGYTKAYTINEFGNPVSLDEPSGKRTDFEWSITSDDEEERNDNVLQKRKILQFPGKIIETQYDYDDQGRLILEAGPEGRVFTQTWNDVGQPLTRQRSVGIAESWTYDPQSHFLLTHTDPRGTITTFTPLPGQAGLSGTMAIADAEPAFEAIFDYDAHGNPKSKTVGAVTTQTTYDDRGLLTSETDGLGVSIEYRYTNDLITAIIFPERAETPCSGAAPPVALQRGYYPNGRLQYEINRNGQRLDYTYTGRGLVTSVTRTVGNHVVTRVLTYNNRGLLANEQDWNGVSTGYGYDELGFRNSITNRANRTMTMVNDFFGNPRSVTDFGGLQTIYGYDGFNRETSRSPQCSDDKCGTFYTSYNDSGSSSEETSSITTTDEDGATTENFYDANGNLVRRINQEGKVSTYGYDARNLLVRATDEDFAVTEYTYDVLGHRNGIIDAGTNGDELTVELVPDPNGNVTSEKRWRKQGDSTTLEERATSYDTWNRPWQRTFGPETECLAYDNEGNITRQVRTVDGQSLSREWLRDTLGRVVRKTDAAQGTTGYEDYDDNGLPHTIINANGHETNITYDDEGRLFQIYEGNGARMLEISTRDGMGNPKDVVDYVGNDWTYVYTSRHLLKQVEPPLEAPTKYTYTKRGQLETVTDAAGFTRRNVYWPTGRLRHTYFPTESTLEASFEFSPGGRPSKTTRLGSVLETLPDSHMRPWKIYQYAAGSGPVQIAEHSYDDVGNITETTDGESLTTKYTYDNRNLLRTTTYPGNTGVEERLYFDTGDLRRIILPKGSDDTDAFVDFTYDGEGRPTSRTMGGEMASWGYDGMGNRTSETRPKGQSSGKQRIFTPDALNRLHVVKDEAGIETTFEYDDNDNLTWITRPGDASVHYTYDELNRRTKRDDWLNSGLQTIEYLDFDGHGNAEHVKTASGVREYHYDHYDRPVSASFPISPVAAYQTSELGWVHDDVAGKTTITETKQRPTGETFTEQTEETFDKGSGQLLSSIQRGTTIGYEYYRNGDLLAVTSSGGRTEYTYDGRHIPTSATITSPGAFAPMATILGYHADGRIKTISRPGSTTSFDYWDGTRRTKKISNSFAQEETSSVSYAYDQNGNVTSRIDTEDGVANVTSFPDYDDADRLKEFRQDGATTKYTYKNYNRDTEIVTRGGIVANRTYAYDAGVQLRSIEDTATTPPTLTTFGYDVDGNNTSIEISNAPGERATFAYDARNQLVRAVRGPPNSAPVGLYDYNSYGQRIRHQGSLRGDIENFVDASGAVVDEVVDGTDFHHYHRAVGILAQDGPAGRDYFYQDSQGSVTQLASEAGTRSATLKYDPWGKVRPGSGNTSDTSYRYTGQQLDEQTGLYYYGSRHYNPAVGRFQSLDSFLGTSALPESMERYGYVYNNPAKYVDPNGHFAVLPLLIVAGVTGTLSGGIYLATAPDPSLTGFAGAFGEGALLGAATELGLVAAAGAFRSGLFVADAFVGAEGALAASRFGVQATKYAGFAGGGIAMQAGEDLWHGELSSGGQYATSAALNIMIGKFGERVGSALTRAGRQGVSTIERDLLSARSTTGPPTAWQIAKSAEAGERARSIAYLSERDGFTCALTPQATEAHFASELAHGPGSAGAAKASDYAVILGEMPTGRTILSNEVGSTIAADALADAGRGARRLPPEVLERFQIGNNFNRARAFDYPYRELAIEKPPGASLHERPWTVDGYNPGREIVSRKYTQLSAVQEDTALGYVRELSRKYAPGRRIADVPSVPPHLRGQVLTGDMVLEVTRQLSPVPRSVVGLADELGIVIRDSYGTVYR